MKIVTKRDGMIILSRKRNSKSKIFTRDKGYYTLVNGSFHQENNYKHYCYRHQSSKIREKTDRN